MRGGRASGAGAVREFRDGRAGRRAGAVPGSGIAGFTIAGFAGCGAGGLPGRERFGNFGITGRGRARLRRPVPPGAPASSPARAKRARGRCEGRRPTGARPRGGAPSSTMPARTPAVPGRSVGRDRAMSTPRELRLRGSGRRHAPTAPRGHPDRLPIKARPRPLRERAMVRPRPARRCRRGHPGCGETRRGRKTGRD